MKSLIPVSCLILLCGFAQAQASEAHTLRATPADRADTCAHGGERHGLEYAHWNEYLATRAGDSQSARDWAERARAECRELASERRDGPERPEARPDVRQERARRRELARR
ncbi:MAG TPA: hypothetical protein PKX01_01710 [Rhodocyclaceae bacterium]|uniref:hypothetical protein n=1 Tax=Zoogloea sp. TaxID=49181 RepID=UPI002B5F101E|nr:hypothetical protein [Zoogloea sp.]HMW53703.1 hypothetical protein [Rhodocyclaceae bacterium]HMZ74863.1 hypothetical protein [Rhodocyclaceae bacterium]HNH16927.1 hypothetical protein [Zoogloea sp.]HNI82503.1 hypothetical protein [Rhodocyclaceae bacterium]